MAQVYDEASMVANDDGNVAVDGPGNVAVMLTPEAAAETADRLLECAGKAFEERNRSDNATSPSPRIILDIRAQDRHR